MELKLSKNTTSDADITFNRTAYGIETFLKITAKVHSHRTFNRTAYGIETFKKKEP